jgi:hypothetical protein
MKKQILSLALVAGLMMSLPSVCSPQDFRTAMKNVFGKDFKDYQWLNYPVNNFGVGTAYKGTNAKFSNKGFLCATFSCFDAPVPKDADKWLRVNIGPEEYADPGCGGPVDVTFQKNKDLVLGAVLPQIFSVIGLSANLQKTGTSVAEIKSASMCSRLLQQEKMNEYIRNLQTDKYGLKRSYENDRLVLIVGDLVISNMTVSVKADQGLKAGLDSKLQGKVEKVLGQGANFGVKLTKSSASTYEMKITEPVIAAVLAVRQGPDRDVSNSAGQGNDVVSPWIGWHVTSVPMPPRLKRTKHR